MSTFPKHFGSSPFYKWAASWLTFNQQHVDLIKYLYSWYVWKMQANHTRVYNNLLKGICRADGLIVGPNWLSMTPFFILQDLPIFSNWQIWTFLSFINTIDILLCMVEALLPWWNDYVVTSFEFSTSLWNLVYFWHRFQFQSKAISSSTLQICHLATWTMQEFSRVHFKSSLLSSFVRTLSNLNFNTSLIKLGLGISKSSYLILIQNYFSFWPVIAAREDGDKVEMNQMDDTSCVRDWK